MKPLTHEPERLSYGRTWGRWHVQSKTNPKVGYLVLYGGEANGKHCTCEGYRYRKDCSHLDDARLFWDWGFNGGGRKHPFKISQGKDDEQSTPGSAEGGSGTPAQSH